VIAGFVTWRTAFAAVVAVTTLSMPADPLNGYDFTLDVLPVLQRAGCSSAYCHGSATGRAGFRLSLFGSDPAADFKAITTQLGGRRVDLRQPERSLILQKALGNLVHGGGRRLRVDSSAHERLRAWIAAGAPWRAQQSKELRDLKVAVVDDRLVATATFADGALTSGWCESSQDVSDMALFATSDPTVVEVDAAGTLTYRGKGQAHVTARFGNLTATARLLRPFTSPLASEFVASGTSLDRAWHRHLDELGITPKPTVSPAQLARRLHLDLVARPPTPQELDEFVAACSDTGDLAATIAAGVARLTQRREFAEVWGGHLAAWFELPSPQERGPAGQAAIQHRAALIAGIEQGLSLTGIARRLVLGERQGSGVNPSMMDRFGDARDRAEYAGRTLLGKRIGCARCHDHPSDRWRQSEHLAFSACFAPSRPDGSGGMTAGAMFDADSGQQVTPRLLGLSPAGAAAATAIVSDVDGRRAQLNDFLLARDHDSFAKNACNRLFAILFGRGLVEPVDDHRLGNPPTDAGMLAALVLKFHECDGSLPDLLSYLMTAVAYAAPSAGSAASDHDAEVAHFASCASRSLPPRIYLRALAAVVGREPTEEVPAMALARELAVRNGPLVRQLLAAGGTTIDATFDLCAGPEERLTQLWRTVLSREPSHEERARFLPFASDLAAYRDLAFALLTGREFGHRR